MSKIHKKGSTDGIANFMLDSWEICLLWSGMFDNQQSTSQVPICLFPTIETMIYDTEYLAHRIGYVFIRLSKKAFHYSEYHSKLGNKGMELSPRSPFSILYQRSFSQIQENRL